MTNPLDDAPRRDSSDLDDEFPPPFLPPGGFAEFVSHRIIEEVSGIELPDEIRAELAINPSNLDGEMLRQTDSFARWAVRAAEASALAEKARYALDHATAQIDASLRRIAIDAGRRTTEDMLKAQIRIHPHVMAAQQTYIDAKAEAAILAKLELAMKMRADMLINLSATLRRELASVR